MLRGNSWSQFTTHPGATAVSEDLTMTILTAYVGAVVSGGSPAVTRSCSANQQDDLTPSWKWRLSLANR